MMDLGVLFVLLLVAGLLCWSARPAAGHTSKKEWSGEQAADMTGGLILAFAALGGIWQNLSGNDAATLLLNSLAWYAALPLLVCVRIIQAAQRLGYAWHWDRMIWGRIFLALCVVFELSRRADQLSFIIDVSAILGAISLIIIAIRPQFNIVGGLLATSWTVSAIGYFIVQPNSVIWLGLPVAILLAFKFNAKINT